MPNKKRSRNTNSHKKRVRKSKPKRRLPAQPDKNKVAQLPSGESIADSTSTTDSVHGQSRTASQEKLAGFSESSFVSAGGPGLNEIVADSAKNITRNNNEEVANPEGDLPSSIDWNPTISNEEMGSVGQECSKPNDTMTMDSDDKTIQANLRIVSSNIRRKKMIIWMLVFVLGLICEGFIDLLLAIIKEKTEVFSMNLIKPYLFPTLASEFGLTLVGVFFIALKLGFLRTEWVDKAYRFVTVFNCLRYLLLMFLLPLGLYLFNTELATDMKRQLTIAFDKPENSQIWMDTQSYRQCCGITNQTDWLVPDARHLHKHGVLTDAEYPASCCRDYNATTSNLTNSEIVCTDISGNLWSTGCHRAEFLSMLDYILWFIAYVFLAFILTVFIRVWTDKLERYMIVFRPREVF